MQYHIDYGTNGSVTALSEKGRNHIETLHLNRAALIERRAQVIRAQREHERIAAITDEIQALYEDLRNLGHADYEN